jgi:hypothetical protein
MLTDYISTLSPHCIFGDKRLKLRFLTILEAKIANISQPLTKLFKKKQDSRQAYDFFRNVKVNSEMLIANERARLIYFIEQLKPRLIFVVQDTTTLDFSKNRSSDQLGYLQNEYQKGIYLHNSLIINENGVPLGLFNQHFWSRDANAFGIKKTQRKELPIEDKESFRWLTSLRLVCESFENSPQTTVVNIMDREGDIYDVLIEERPDNVHYIVRARGDRKSILHNLPIRPTLEKIAPNAQFSYEIPVKSAVSASQIREAKLELRYSKITVKQPSTQSRKPPVDIWVVWVTEVGCPDGELPVDWLLFTSLPIENSEGAFNLVRYYGYRWRIEQFHKVLKSDGAQITTVQFEEEQTLKSVISTYSLASVQVLNLQYTARELPSTSLKDLAIEEGIYTIGATYLNRIAGTKLDAKKENPTISDLLIVVGHLGGFSFQKGKNMGPKTIRYGLMKLLDIKTTFDAFMSG